MVSSAVSVGSAAVSSSELGVDDVTLASVAAAVNRPESRSRGTVAGVLDDRLCSLATL